MVDGFWRLHGGFVGFSKKVKLSERNLGLLTARLARGLVDGFWWRLHGGFVCSIAEQSQDPLQEGGSLHVPGRRSQHVEVDRVFARVQELRAILILSLLQTQVNIILLFWMCFL